MGSIQQRQLLCCISIMGCHLPWLVCVVGERRDAGRAFHVIHQAAGNVRIVVCATRLKEVVCAMRLKEVILLLLHLLRVLHPDLCHPCNIQGAAGIKFAAQKQFLVLWIVIPQPCHQRSCHRPSQSCQCPSITCQYHQQSSQHLSRTCQYTRVVHG